METLIRICKKIVFIPPAAVILVSVFGYGMVIAVLALGVRQPVLAYTAYFASAYALTVTVAWIVRIFRGGGIKAAFFSHPAVKKIAGYEPVGKYRTNIKFRTGVSLYQGILINLLYIALKLVSGILYRSAWFLSLAVYYAILALMRFLLARKLGAKDRAEELKRYRLCGILLLFMNQALAGIVILIVQKNESFHYPGYVIYAMAAYSFYAVISAVIQTVKTRRHKSPVLSAAKAVGLVTAMVSILSLETAMLSEFGAEESPLFRQVMTGATGGAVCLIVTAMAVYMIGKAGRELKMEKEKKI